MEESQESRGLCETETRRLLRIRVRAPSSNIKTRETGPNRKDYTQRAQDDLSGASKSAPCGKKETAIGKIARKRPEAEKQDQRLVCRGRTRDFA